MLPLVIWSIFQGREYLTGNSYIPYLKNNMQTVELGGEADFSILNEDLEEPGLFLVGEIHGFEVPLQLDHELFAYLNYGHDFDTYLLEMDVSQAYFMNRYNETGDDSLLQRILSTWVVRPGRDNIDYMNRYKKLREVYQNGDGFTYLGTNGISDTELLSLHLSELLPDHLWEMDPSLEDSTQLAAFQDQLRPLLEEQQSLSISDRDMMDLHMIQKNIAYALEDRHREEVLTQNTYDLYALMNLKSQNVYGYYGLGHTIK
ncbi:MAG: hypothetical protein R3222_09020, partial [Balneolaceae bacterium]|nr:hypothetical protein [Balneolaceae bacterium]